MSSSTVARIEREQKFLVDVDEFMKFLQTSKGVRSSHVRQCYLALDHGDGGFEVRLRESGAKSFGVDYTLTAKRRRDVETDRDELEWPATEADFLVAWAASPWRAEKTRYVGDALGGWQVDVFRGGPLGGVAVAELELPAGFDGTVGSYLALTKLPWPKWLAPTLRLSDHDRVSVDLTAERVNLVAAYAVEASSRLRRIIDAECERRAIKPQLSYATSPRNRQGVVDLDATARLRKGAGR